MRPTPRASRRRPCGARIAGWSCSPGAEVYPGSITTKTSFLTTPEYQRLRWSGLAEGISFLVLLGIAMPMKYLAGRPEAVRVVGSLHGVLFIIYVVMALLAARARKWPGSLLGQAMIAAVVPLGPFWFDSKIKSDPNA